MLGRLFATLNRVITKASSESDIRAKIWRNQGRNSWRNSILVGNGKCKGPEHRELRVQWKKQAHKRNPLTIRQDRWPREETFATSLREAVAQFWRGAAERTLDIAGSTWVAGSLLNWTIVHVTRGKERNVLWQHRAGCGPGEPDQRPRLKPTSPFSKQPLSLLVHCSFFAHDLLLSRWCNLRLRV